MYALLYASMHLGYYISPTKSTIIPTQSMVHLGFGIDSRTSSYSITDKYRKKFQAYRVALLERGEANLTDLQSWFGKCSHLKLVFPATSLFTFNVRQLMSVFGEDRQPLPVEVMEEIRFWSFVDSYTEPVPFFLNQHVSLRLFTDASGFGWGAHFNLPSGPSSLRDYWTTELLGHDICVKEALAVLFGLQAIEGSLFRRRTDVFVDNQGLVLAWEGLKSRSLELTGVLKTLFLFCMDLRVHLKMIWIPTKKNLADGPSRELDRSDSTLSLRLRRRLWSVFGPFSFDLMALSSNVFARPDGSVLPFFSRFPHPRAAGVNVFAQRPPVGRLYVFPPFNMIPPLINLFVEWGGVEVVLVLPFHQDRIPDWMGLLHPYIQDACLLAPPGGLGVLCFPSPSGFRENLLPVAFGIKAFRCLFPAKPVAVSAPLVSVKRLRVFIFSDSMLRPLRALAWPEPLGVVVRCFSGATLLQVLARCTPLSAMACDVVLLHAGVNDASRNVAAFDVGFAASCARLQEVLPTRFASARVVISTMCQTKSADMNLRVAAGNQMLREAALARGWSLMSNDNIQYDDLVDTVHLNASGTAKIFRNIVNTLKSMVP